VHKVYLWDGALIVVSVPVRLVISATGPWRALEQFPDVRSVRLQADRREVRLKPDTTYYTESKTALEALGSRHGPGSGVEDVTEIEPTVDA